MSYGTVYGVGFVRPALGAVDPPGREVRRPPSVAVDQIRVRHQPANGQGAWAQVPPPARCADEVIE